MTRVFVFCTALLAWLPYGSVNADPPTQQIAGRELASWAADLNSDNRTARLRAAKTLGAFESAAAPILADALQSDDAAVRYIAAVQLGHIGGDSLGKHIDSLQLLRDDGDQPAVQLAAAFALCRAGNVEGNLDFLAERLEFAERGMACSAAELLGMLGKVALPAVPALEKALAANRPGGKGDYHIGGASINALRQIQSETPRTPPPVNGKY